MTLQLSALARRTVVLATLSLVSFACSSPETGTAQTFAGVITDSECETGDHSGMRMGSNDAECVQACIAGHGADFMLRAGNQTYALSDQAAPKQFAGLQVDVSGTLASDGTTIQVESITARQ